MAKVFEDRFMEVQISMLQEAFDCIYYDVDKIYLYAACEAKQMSVAFFYEKDNKIFDSHDIYVFAKQNNDQDGLSSRLRKMMALLESLVSICEEYDRPMPTEIKLYYDCNEGKLNTEYQYEPVFSFIEDRIAHEVFTEWVEETKRAKGQ